MTLAAEETAKSKAAKEVIKSLTAQLKDMTEWLPPRSCKVESIRTVHLLNGFEQNGLHSANANGQRSSQSDSISNSSLSPTKMAAGSVNGHWPNAQLPTNRARASGRDDLADERVRTSNGLPEGNADNQSLPFQDGDSGVQSRNTTWAINASQVEAEWIEQYEPGVYITLVALRDGTRDLKRVRFSRRRFGEHQAEAWWSENREKVYEKYNVRGLDKSTAGKRSDGAHSPSSQA